MFRKQDDETGVGEAGLPTQYMACCDKQKTNFLFPSNYTLHLFQFLVSFSPTGTHISIFIKTLVNLKENYIHTGSPLTQNNCSYDHLGVSMCQILFSTSFILLSWYCLPTRACAHTQSIQLPLCIQKRWKNYALPRKLSCQTRATPWRVYLEITGQFRKRVTQHKPEE